MTSVGASLSTPPAGGPPAFAIEGVTRRFGEVVAVDDLWLDIREGEFFSLLGPSGCGKTTTLRMLAGFETPDEGTIRLRGEDVTDTPPNRRNTNLVFQHYELFPHMTVFQNVAYGLRLKKVKEPELSTRVREALRIVRVEELADRGARQLSGGQQQRVALARAIVNRPAVLLLDEPLSALDVKLRKQMQLELKAIQHQLGTTFVYVTHDQEEALLLSDRIGIMSHGKLLQVADPRRIYDHPADGFVADFVGSLNVFDGRVAEVAGDLAVVFPEGLEATGDVTPRLVVRADGLAPGAAVRVAVRPERIAIAAADGGGVDGGGVLAGPDPGIDGSVLAGTVAAVNYLGAVTQVVVAVPGGRPVLIQRTSDGRLAGIAEHTRVRLAWAADAAFVLPRDGA
ncbi:MAG: ABC transporter ATP-binding protein [Chloroflexota bacterium]